MPRSQGFARGDLDTAFPLDDKFLDLRGRLSSDRYYAATGVYWTVVAATWREADRKVALRVAPDAADLIDELVAVKLLDPDGRVPSRSFTAWVGRAKRQRKVTSDRQARNRAGMSRSVTRDIGVTNGDVRVTSRESQPARASAPQGQEGTAGTETGGAGGTDDRDSLDTYHELTLFRPWGVWSGEKIRAAMNDYGDARVDAAMRAEATADPDRKTLLDRTLARLARDAEKAKQERKARQPKPPVNEEVRQRILEETRRVKGMTA